MDHVTKLLSYYLLLHDNITAFRFVIYNRDREVRVRSYYWVKVKDLQSNLEWLGQQGIKLAEEHGLHPAQLALGLVNSVLVRSNIGGKIVRRYIPMIDFPAVIARPDEAPEQFLVALEMLGMCPGVIVRSSTMNFNFVGFHFFGFGLWTRARWTQLVADGVFDEYGFSKDRSIPMYPKMPYYAAKVIGESWWRLVRKQHGIAFLRVAENNSADSQPKVIELFFAGTQLLVEPPEYAPCMPPFRAAETAWYDSMDKWHRFVLEHYPKGTRFNTGPKLEDFCVPTCPLNGCSLECPATAVRLERKVRRVRGSSEVIQHKLSGIKERKLLSE